MIPARNGIGHFQIGVSPIGTQSYFDWQKTVISQYANSPTLMQLIENFWGYVDQSRNLDAFFDLVWNVDTAQGWGLDVWGRIVGVGRVVFLPVPGVYLGASGPDGASGDSMNVAPFWNGQPTTENFALSDDAYRVLILAKALTNISDGSVPSINQILINLFRGRGNAYVIDSGDMEMIYKFDFVLTDVEFAIVSQSGALPKPVGVQATVEQAY